MSYYSPRSSISSYTSMSSSAASSLAMDIRPRSSSTNGSFSSAWPYRSCLTAATHDEPNSYLSDEDLFGSEDDALSSPAIEELSTEEQIAMLRKAQEQQPASQMWYYRQQAQYQNAQEQQRRKSSRPCMGKKKKSSSQKKVVFASPAQG